MACCTIINISTTTKDLAPTPSAPHLRAVLSGTLNPSTHALSQDVEAEFLVLQRHFIDCYPLCTFDPTSPLLSLSDIWIYAQVDFRTYLRKGNNTNSKRRQIG
jgi:hypothetical protein